MSIDTVQLQRLRPGHEAPGGGVNARVSERDNGIAELAQSILSEGLLVPLTVWGDGSRTNADAVYVVDGNRRLAALQLLARDDKMPKHEPVECRIVVAQSAAHAREKSLATHVFHLPLHPIDRFEAFASLVAQGIEADEIAERFSMKRKDVERTLALGGLAPEIRAAWRAGHLSDEAARAFTISTDHERQADVYRKLKRAGTLYPSSIKTALAGTEARAALGIVGRDAYVAAGGVVTADLFGDGVFVSDPQLLQNLLDQRLDEECDKLVKAGWGWAEHSKKLGDEVFRMVPHADGRTLPKKDRPKFGCAVGIGYDGKLEIIYGLKRKAEKAATTTKGETGDRTKKKKQSADPTEITNALKHRLDETLDKATQDALWSLSAAPGREDDPMIEVLATVVGEMITPGRSSWNGVLAENMPKIRDAMPAKLMNATMLQVFNAEDYFGAINRAQLAGAIAEMGGGVLEAAKKGELATQAEALQKKTRWLPAELRTSHYDGPGAAKPKLGPKRKAKRR